MDRPFNLADVKPIDNSLDSVIQGLKQSYTTTKQPTYEKGSFFDTMSQTETFFYDYATDKTRSDSHVQLNDGTWVARYETYDPNRDNAKYYAETQTTGDKWLNGLQKFAGKTGTAILGGTLGTVAGVKDWITTGNMTTLYDNDFSRYLDDLNVQMDNKLPNYYTEAEQDAGFFQSLGSVNFYANDLLGGLSFTVGAIGSELIWGAATGGASLSTTGARLGAKFGSITIAKNLSKSLVKKSTQKLIKEGAESVIEGVERSAFKGWSLPLDVAQEGLETSVKQWSVLGGKAGAIANTGRFALTSAGYESGVEALQFRKEAENNFYYDFRSKNGREPNQEETTDFIQKLNSASNGLYGYNLALVGSSNLIMLGKMFDVKNPLTAPSKWVNKKVFGVGLDTSTNTVVKATRPQKIAQTVFTIGSPMFTEGIIEEGGQAVGSGTAQNWIEASYDPKYTKNSLGLGDAFLDSLDETYTTKEGWKEIGLGALIGALTGGAGAVYNRARGRQTESDFGRIDREANEMMAFNKDYSPHKMANMMFYANRIQNANEQSEKADAEGNITLAEKARRDKALAQMVHAYNLEYFSETIEDTNIALQTLDVNKLAEERGVSIEEAQAEKDRAISDYNSIAKSFKLNRDFAESYFGDMLRREGLDYTQTTTLKDAIAYELTQGEKSWEFSRDILSAIQNEVKNVIGADQAMSLKDVYENANPQLKKDFDQVITEIRNNERLLEETENKRKNLSFIRTNDIEVNKERANTLNNLVVELSKLTERKQQLENRLNILTEASNIDNPFSSEASPIISTQDVLRLEETLKNINVLVRNNTKLQNLMQEYERSTKELVRYTQLTKQLKDPNLQADGAKGLAKLLLGNSKKLNDITSQFIEGLQGSRDLINEQRVATNIRVLQPVDQAIETVEGLEEVTTIVPTTPLTITQEIIQNNKEYFSRKGIETDEQLNQAFPTQEELDRFELLVQKASRDNRFTEDADVEQIESRRLTEAEQNELNNLYDKMDAWQMLSTFENDGISIADIFEMQEQNQQTPKEVRAEVTTSEFSDMVGESSSRGANQRSENLSQTPDGVQFRENRGKYTVHNLTLSGLLSQIGSNDLVSIEEGGEYQVLPNAVSNDVGTKIRVNYPDGQHTILTVVAGGVIEIENEIVFLSNSNYTPITYSGQSNSSYSPLYYKDGDAVESDFNNDATYNTDAIYNLRQGDTIYFKVDLNDPYNQTLVGQSDDVVEKQLKVFIVDQSGNILGDLKANRDVFGSDGFNLIRKEAFNLFKSNQSGNISTTSSVNSVMLGVPKFTLNQDGLPTNKTFNTDAILDWGYWDSSKFDLREGVSDIRTTFVSKFKRKLPIVVFRIGNQNVAFPVNMVTTPRPSNINLLDIINDQSVSLAKQVIKINNLLLDKGFEGNLFYIGDDNQNIFKDVSTQEMSDVFKIAQSNLDSEVQELNLLELDITQLAGNILTPIDFSNKPLSSPRVAFDLSNLSTQSLNQETVTAIGPSGEVIVEPNPIKVTQEANKEIQREINRQLPIVQNTSLITTKDRGNEVSYSVKAFDTNDTQTIQEIRNILERGDTVFPKGSSGTYEYNGSSLILVRGNGVTTISDLSTLSRGLEIYKSKFNSNKVQDKKEVIEADSSLINRAKKQQNKKC